MDASPNSPRSGESVSDEQYDEQTATVQFFKLYEGLLRDHYNHVIKAVRAEDYEQAHYELTRLQTDLEVLRELIER